MKFDDASWHVNSVEVECDDVYGIAAGHIVAYLRWALKRGWAGELLTDYPSSNIALENALSGHSTFTALFGDECDWKFQVDDLTGDGLEFTKYFYSEHYFRFIAECAGNSIFIHKAEDYPLDEISTQLDLEFMKWKRQTHPA